MTAPAFTSLGKEVLDSSGRHYADARNPEAAEHIAAALNVGAGWQPIATAPELERIWVCGWQQPHGSTRGYWWWHEDAVCDGKAFEHPEALYWAEIVLPAFPDRPTQMAIAS